MSSPSDYKIPDESVTSPDIMVLTEAFTITVVLVTLFGCCTTCRTSRTCYKRSLLVAAIALYSLPLMYLIMVNNVYIYDADKYNHNVELSKTTCSVYDVKYEVVPNDRIRFTVWYVNYETVNHNRTNSYTAFCPTLYPCYPFVGSKLDCYPYKDGVVRFPPLVNIDELRNFFVFGVVQLLLGYIGATWMVVFLGLDVADTLRNMFGDNIYANLCPYIKTVITECLCNLVDYLCVCYYYIVDDYRRRSEENAQQQIDSVRQSAIQSADQLNRRVDNDISPIRLARQILVRNEIRRIASEENIDDQNNNIEQHSNVDQHSNIDQLCPDLVSIAIKPTQQISNTSSVVTNDTSCNVACIVCLERKPAYMFSECYHVCLCAVCNEKYTDTRCVVCRKSSRRIRVFV